MSILQKKYRRSVFLAVLLHVTLLAILIFEIVPTQYRANISPHANAKIIQAKAVTITQLQTETKEIVAQQQAAQAEKEKALAEAHEKILKEKKLVELKATQAKLALQAAQEKKLKQEKLKQEKIKKQKLKQAKIAALKKEQATLQQKLMQQQLQSDQHALTEATIQANQGAIDQYKAQILAAIQSNWRISEVNDKLKCIYVVQIAPGGAVLSAQLQQSSGDSALDQSAREAIFKSSPLPVPHDAALFDHFRRLVLTLSPQGYLR